MDQRSALTIVDDTVMAPSAERRRRSSRRAFVALAILMVSTLVLSGTAPVTAAHAKGTDPLVDVVDELPAPEVTAEMPSAIGAAMQLSGPTANREASKAGSSGGGCEITLGVSSCISVDSSGCFRPDFYVNTLSGLPAGTRFDVITVDKDGRFEIPKKGILDRTGHYGPWSVCLGNLDAALSHVVVSDPSGTIIYYFASSPTAYS